MNIQPDQDGAPAIEEMTHEKRDLDVPWGIQRLKVSPLWKLGLTGESVRVGHLDTGVDGNHPALRGVIENFVYFDNAGNEKSSNRGKPFDTGEHGTHTAGTIAGRPVNGTVIGVAPGAKLISAVVIDDGNVRARILAGTKWMITQGIRVLNISVGLHGWCRSFLPAMREVCKQGILPVAAVGDEGPGTTIAPGNYSDVLSVGACDECDSVPDFSSSQRFSHRNERIVPKIIAPGDKIRSAAPEGSYQVMAGTSMAAAHVSGLAALLCQAAPWASAEDIKSAILRSCQLPSGVPIERGNLGIPNAVVALNILAGIHIAGM